MPRSLYTQRILRLIWVTISTLSISATIHAAAAESGNQDNPIKKRLMRFVRDEQRKYHNNVSLEQIIDHYNQGRAVFKKYYQPPIDTPLASAASLPSLVASSRPPRTLPASSSLSQLTHKGSRLAQDAASSAKELASNVGSSIARAGHSLESSVASLTRSASDSFSSFFGWRPSPAPSPVPPAASAARLPQALPRVVEEEPEGTATLSDNLHITDTDSPYSPSSPAAQPAAPQAPVLAAAAAASEEDWIPVNFMTDNDVQDLIWFLYLYCGLFDPRGIFFEEGSFIIRGNNVGNIFNSLPRYRRLSSHLQVFESKHFGHDINPFNAFPAGKGTILFALLTEEKQASNNLLFIKPENYGVSFDLTLENLTSGLMHMEEWGVSILRKIPVVQQTLGLRSDDDPAFRKERVPQNILAEATRLLKRVEFDAQTRHEAEEAFKNFGIQKIVGILHNYEKDDVEIQRFLNYIRQRYPDWAQRIGNEALYNAEQLLQAPTLKLEETGTIIACPPKITIPH